jgi:hypothetical protein
MSGLLFTVAVTTVGPVRPAAAQPSASQLEGADGDTLLMLVTVNSFVDNLDALHAKKRELLRTTSKDEADTELERLLLTTAIRDQSAAIQATCVDVQKKARLAADEGTVAAMRSAVAIYYARHDGRWPPDEATVASLMTPPLEFECPGNDFTCDARSGEVTLLITDVARC